MCSTRIWYTLRAQQTCSKQNNNVLYVPSARHTVTQTAYLSSATSLVKLTAACKDAYWCSSFLHRHSSITVTGMFNSRSVLPRLHLSFFPPSLPWSTVVIVDHCSPVVPGQSGLYCYTSFYFLRLTKEKMDSCALPHGCSVNCVLSPVIVCAFSRNVAILKHLTPRRCIVYYNVYSY